MSLITGRYLNRKWSIGAEHALYREDGCWYHHLRQFPGALCDAYGYIIFETEGVYKKCPQLRHGQQLNVSGGISSIPGYVKVE